MAGIRNSIPEIITRLGQLVVFCLCSRLTYIECSNLGPDDICCYNAIAARSCAPPPNNHSVPLNATCGHVVKRNQLEAAFSLSNPVRRSADLVGPAKVQLPVSPRNRPL